MKNESLIIILFLVILSWFTMFGIYFTFWGNPHKKAQIRQLSAEVEVWHNRAIELESAVADYQRALKFENLFLMVADANQVMTLDKYLQQQVDNKAEFCLGDVKP